MMKIMEITTTTLHNLAVKEKRVDQVENLELKTDKDLITDQTTKADKDHLEIEDNLEIEDHPVKDLDRAQTPICKVVAVVEKEEVQPHQLVQLNQEDQEVDREDQEVDQEDQEVDQEDQLVQRVLQADVEEEDHQDKVDKARIEEVNRDKIQIKDVKEELQEEVNKEATILLESINSLQKEETADKEDKPVPEKETVTGITTIKQIC